MKCTLGALTAPADAIGPWERFAYGSDATGAVINARHENKWVSQDAAGKLQATASTGALGQRFTFHSSGRIRSNTGQLKHVRLDANNNLVADTNHAGATIFTRVILAY